MKYLLNRWYAAGWSHEITRDLKVKTLLDEPILFYRTQSDEAVAMSDRCPHRRAPLHCGQLFDDTVRCPYHGLRFDPTGQCVDNPIGGGRIPPKSKLETFPLTEANGIVWIWFGKAEPDYSKVVRFDFLDEPANYAFVEGYMAVEASYTLVSDNLLDLSHAEFLHPNLSSAGSNKRVKLSVEQDGEVVRALNWRPSEPTTAMIRMALGENAEDVVDMWSNVTWHPPAAICVEVGATTVGGLKANGVNTLAAHLITPETEKRSHYFWKMARTFNRDDAEFSKGFQALIQSAFATEDRPIIEAQQRYLQIGSSTAPQTVFLRSDDAALRAKRILTDLIQSQANAGSTLCAASHGGNAESS